MHKKFVWKQWVIHKQTSSSFGKYKPSVQQNNDVKVYHGHLIKLLHRASVGYYKKNKVNA